MKKRVFDVVLSVVAAVVWVPVLVFVTLAILILEGRPVFYVSKRRIDTAGPVPMAKFRTMVKNADKIANRETVPVVNNTRFLNIPPDSPLYTGIGRLVEKCQFTELPQIFLVMRGKLSIVGNRPLPQNVVDSLAEIHPHVEDRFLTPAGLTGPVQLVGRTNITDEMRLRIEGQYCRVARYAYSPLLDLRILVRTVLIVAKIRPSLSVDEVCAMLARYEKGRVPAQVRPSIVTEAKALIDARPEALVD